ncbi:hypothetical protein I8751_22750 [Nostocaceae cyanobacterium CENA357]|uniref:Uncharacterized protein n=1 Tax=Atlanticothrix silvestris CENA357 TaxID=1725252 RepID=A0A8J7L4S6_9CYAN|nr:hypothetical protein [Atlanticothrix silvestris]MBH8555116.1 hypothetical protein [Atlanticothrix silvestris CENA357]
MLKIKHSPLTCLGVGITLATIAAMSYPVYAQSAIWINGASGVSNSPAVGSFIYGSPIPTPMPVDPATGLMPSRTNYPAYSYPRVRQKVRNSTLINPTLINPVIRDSTLVNPVIINNSRHGRPLRHRSRIILTYP